VLAYAHISLAVETRPRAAPPADAAATEPLAERPPRRDEPERL
jgi:hypothetical protein